MTSALAYTPVSQIAQLVSEARRAFDSGKTRPIEWRIQQIKALRKMMMENYEPIHKAMYADLRKPETEAIVAEVHTVIAECNDALNHIWEWTAAQKVPTPPLLVPGSSHIQYEPVGVVLIIAPWNFPLQLCLNPAIAALAAGNSIVIKPSEVAPASAKLMQELLPKYLDMDAIKFVQGAVAETTALLKERFDHILYTGNDKVARVVMRAAAEHLTPVTLELGGKSPTIVDSTADLDLAAKRIIGSKYLNAGQVCVAPDYVLVEKQVEEKLVEKMNAAIVEFYGQDPQKSADLARIVNKQHFGRVKKLMDESGGKVSAGGNCDEADCYIAPTIIRDPNLDSAIMKDEIFGPLLPVLSVATVDEAISFVNKREKPLALYVFTESAKNRKKVLASTSAGGTTINDCLLHAVNPSLPFGGIGNSGQGAYHGKFGFETFSHRKAVFHQSSVRMLDVGPLRFPPFSKTKLKVIDKLMTSMPNLPSAGFKDFLIVGLAVAVAVLGAKVGGQF